MSILGDDGFTRVVQLRTASGGTAWIIGTAHLSRADAVDHLMQQVKPHTVALELCPLRAASLGIPANRLLPPAVPHADVFPGLFGIAMAVMLSHMSSSMSDMYEETQYGGEQQVALKRGLQFGARIALVDRSMHVTLARAAYAMQWRELYEQLPSALGCIELPPHYAAPPSLLLRLAFGALTHQFDLVADTLDALVLHASAHDATFTSSRTGRAIAQWNTVITAIIRSGQLSTYTRADVQHYFQRLVSAMTTDATVLASMPAAFTSERDVLLAHAIKACPGDRVVAVVGAGHVDGIVRAWATPADGVAQLYEPPPLHTLRVVAVPVVVTVASGYGLYRLHRASRPAFFGAVGALGGCVAACAALGYAMNSVTERVRGALSVQR